MVPLVDLKAQYRSIKPEIDAAIARILESSQFVLGEAVAAFERDFAAYCGTDHAVAVNSGTSALHLSFLAAGIGAGDEVITTPFTFVATVAAILYGGARPVLVDIDPKNFNIDPGKIERAISPRTKAVLPVHLYPNPPTWTRSWNRCGRRKVVRARLERLQLPHGRIAGGGAGSEAEAPGGVDGGAPRPCAPLHATAGRFGRNYAGGDAVRAPRLACVHGAHGGAR